MLCFVKTNVKNIDVTKNQWDGRHNCWSQSAASIFQKIRRIHPFLIAIFPSVFPSIFIVFFLLKTQCRVFMSKFALPKKAIMALCGYVACLSLALQRNAASRDIFTCHVLITVHEEQSA